MADRTPRTPRGRLARPLRPVVESLGHPATDATRLGQIRAVGHEAVQGSPQGRRRLVDVLTGRSPGDRDGLPDPDPDATTEAKPTRPDDGDRHERDAGSQREIGRALADREELGLPDVDPSLARDRHDGAGREDGTDPARRIEQVVLGRLVRDRRPRPGHEPVPTADAHVLLLRSEEPQAGSHRQDGHQDEGVGPAHVVEAVDRRAGRQVARPSSRTRR